MFAADAFRDWMLALANTNLQIVIFEIMCHRNRPYVNDCEFVGCYYKFGSSIFAAPIRSAPVSS
jgi:hypothetical protein